MATWVEPTESETDPDAPLTSGLAKRWDNNVIAAFEGESDAVRMKPKIVYADVTTTTVVSGLSDWYGIMCNYSGTGAGGGGQDVSFAFSEDGVTYTAGTNIIDGEATEFSGTVFINTVTGDYVAQTASVIKTGTIAGGDEDVAYIRLVGAGGGTFAMLGHATGEEV